MNVWEYANGFDVGDNLVHLPRDIIEYDKNVLIFVHTLSAGGSQYAVQCLIKELHILGYGTYVVSPTDGVYRDIFVDEMGAIVVICKFRDLPSDYYLFLKKAFSIVFFNSCVGGFTQIYNNTKVPAIWWMHETYETICSSFFDGPWRPDLLSTNFLLASPWKKVANEFTGSINREMHLLPIYVEDVFRKGDSYRKANEDKTIFLIPGSYEARKGFHKVVEILLRLGQDILEKSEFWFVGFVIEHELYEQMLELSSYMPGVKVIDELSRDEMNAMYEKADCVIIPTLMDSGPLTAVEALMHRKVCIISDAAGVTAYMSDGENALIYDVNDSDALAGKITYFLDNPKEMCYIAENGRKLYLDVFSEKSVVNSLELLIQEATKFNE